MPEVVPEEPKEMVIHGSLETAVQRQPAGLPAEIVMGVETGPPPAATVALAGEMLTLVHGACAQAKEYASRNSPAAAGRKALVRLLIGLSNPI